MVLPSTAGLANCPDWPINDAWRDLLRSSDISLFNCRRREEEEEISWSFCAFNSTQRAFFQHIIEGPEGWEVRGCLSFCVVVFFTLFPFVLFLSFAFADFRWGTALCYPKK